MRTIFITPLLWKKLDRAAIRRGEEGQALVLIAFVIIAMVGMVGLAIDGGLGYLESVKLQRAADAAALAGVPWIPGNRDTADARARLSAEANGVLVACPANIPAPPTPTAYDQRCRSTSWETMTAGAPGQYYTFESAVPQVRGIQYQVTLGKMQQRFFLGVLGFPNYPIVRTAIASYSRLVRFGSSFNYFGTNGVLYDHYMRCDNADLSACGGIVANATLNMYGATYQKYIVMRCDQPNAPTPCIGGFWGHISGPSLIHISGDAYTPIKDGANETPQGSNPLGGGMINATNRLQDCLHTSQSVDPGGGVQGSWFVDNVFPRTGGTCPQISNGYPARNQDYHPDRVTPFQGFGYEIAVEVQAGAIWKLADTKANINNHTNVNITIYDAAEAEIGERNFGTGDNFQNNGPTNSTTIDYLIPPYKNFYNKFSRYQLTTTPINANSATLGWDKKQFVCSPGTVGSHCTSVASGPASAATAARSENLPRNTMGSDWQQIPDTNNFNWTYNDMRTRFTLYGPPAVPVIPSTYANVQGNYIGSFEATDMSVRYQNAIAQEATDVNEFCYMIFDDVKASSFNLRPLPSDPSVNRPVSGTVNYASNATGYSFPGGAGGRGPDYAYNVTTTNSVNATPIPQSQRYAYVCGYASTTAQADYRWNQLLGTPTARFGTSFNDRNISFGILDTGTTNNISSTIGMREVSRSPVVTDIMAIATATNTIYTSLPANVDPSKFNNLASIWYPKGTVTGWDHFVDPVQDCRPSAVDWQNTNTTNNGTWPVDPLWGHNRIPFNMAYGDPLVNKAWITDTTWITSFITNPVASKRIPGYYTLYYSFHGWRCDWDFDSSYTFNPRMDGNSEDASMSNPSLSYQRRISLSGGNNGKWDRAFALGHPGLSSNSYMRQILQTAPAFDGFGSANSTMVNRELLPTGSTDAQFNDDKFDLGLEPYFHLTNISWNGGALQADPTLSDNTARVRAGTYMLHVQVFGGSGANRYSVKAEYENPRVVTDTLIDGRIINVYPVPNVYAVTAMAIYANAVNKNTTQQSVIFDLAFIPQGNAGTQATLQLFDAGDVNTDLNIEILEPSGWGPRISAPAGSAPKSNTTTWNWSVPLGNKIQTRLSACHYTLNVLQLGISGSCYTNSTGQTPKTSQAFRVGGTNYFNDQWALLNFTIPPASNYATWQNQCAQRSVPESLCYYYQINYNLVGTGNANDTTTWQLLVQPQPVHLIPT